MKKIIKIVSVAAMISIAAPVFAQTANTSTQIQSLLNQLQQLQNQLQQLQQQKQAVITNLVATLNQGANSDQVKILQAILAADPDIYPEGIVSGYYGQLTRKAVQRFQKKAGLPQVGVVGPMTLKALNRELEDHPVSLEDSDATSTEKGKKPCAIVPPGHLIAPGWLRKHNGIAPIVPACQTLPPGILNILQRTSSTTDSIAPVISGLTNAVSSTTATISWTTNEPATSQVFYGTSTAMGSSTVFDANLVTSHSQGLSGLIASTTYDYVVQSRDAAGNLASSTQLMFTTIAQ